MQAEGFGALTLMPRPSGLWHGKRSGPLTTSRPCSVPSFPASLFPLRFPITLSTIFFHSSTVTPSHKCIGRTRQGRHPPVQAFPAPSRLRCRRGLRCRGVMRRIEDGPNWPMAPLTPLALPRYICRTWSFCSSDGDLNIAACSLISRPCVAIPGEWVDKVFTHLRHRGCRARRWVVSSYTI